MRASSVPDIATLRAICHGDKLLKDRRSWYAYSRKLSIYITWLLIHTPIRANQVTAVSVAMAALGTLLLAMAPPWVALCGAAAFLVHHLLDKVDLYETGKAMIRDDGIIQ